MLVALLVPCAAHEDWETWDRYLAEALPLLGKGGLVDVDVAESATLAGQLALEGGQLERGAQALQIAREQWMALNRHDRVESIDLLGRG